MKLNLFVRKYVTCCALFAILMLMLIGCGAKKNEAALQTELADSAELVLQFPEELEAHVIREQSIYGEATTEAFYFQANEMQIPLFRIDVGNSELGDWLGALRTKSGDVPVTYTVFVVEEEEMALMGDTLYADLMEGFNTMLDGIVNDPRFTYEKAIEIGEEAPVSMNYWAVDLPESMWITENTENGNYEATFYTEICGENVALYVVRIGDVKAETELGFFEINGEKLAVSVGSFDLPERATWSTDDYSTAYRMMDTINNVIESIMQSKQFSTEAE